MIDVIGIGLGPFNLSLAALLTKTPAISSQFFEQKPCFNWHKNMILPHTTLQVPFLADLVSLIDPTSPFTFLNYLHCHQRLLKFYFLEDFEIFRQEYNHYCQWVVGRLSGLNFSATVTEAKAIDGGYQVTVCQNQKTQTFTAKNLVIATGSTPVLPPFLQDIATKAPKRCMHTANYATHFDVETIARNDRLAKVLIIGSGQSAAEVFRALFEQQLDEAGNPRFAIDWRTRSSGFFPMEYSKLGLEHFSPAYTDYFHSLPTSTKSQLIARQDLLHKGMSVVTISDIYQKLYERSVGNQPTFATLMANCALKAVKLNEDQPTTINVTLHQQEQNQTIQRDYDCVIAGTGYQEGLPDCLSPLLFDIKRDDLGQPVVNRNYTLNVLNDPKTAVGSGHIFVQNQETHSHGVGSGDLGLGAYRAGCIVNQLAGRAIYDTKGLDIFQQFGMAK